MLLKQAAASILTILLGTAHAFAGEPLPLKHGGYVDSSRPCDPPGDAYSMTYYGQVLHSSQMFERMKVTSHHGDVYAITITLTDVTNNLKVGTFKWTATIPNRTTITLKTPYGTSTYRWCTENMAL